MIAGSAHAYYDISFFEGPFFAVKGTFPILEAICKESLVVAEFILKTGKLPFASLSVKEAAPVQELVAVLKFSTEGHVVGTQLPFHHPVVPFLVPLIVV